MRLTLPILTRRRVLAVAILALALALRVWDLRARALWFDEASEFWVATSPLSHLAASVRQGSGDPPLYSFLLHAWMAFGTGEVWLRALSVAFSMAGVLGVMVFTRALAGSGAAIAAGAIAAVLPIDIRYAQEAGQYALVPAAVAWNLFALRRMATDHGWRWVLAWTGTALFAAYAYYGTVFPVAVPFACAVAEAVFRRDLRTRRTTGTALVLCVLGLLPLLIGILPAQLSRVVESAAGATARQSAGAGLAALLSGVWTKLSELLAFQFIGWPHTRLPAAVPIVAVLVLFALSARTQRRVFAWLVATWAVYASVAAAGLFPLGHRWGIIMTPLFLPMIGAAVAEARSLRTRVVAWTAFVVLAGACVVSLPNRSFRERIYAEENFAWPETEDMRALVSFWRETRADGQPTYVYYGAAPAFAYYTRAIAPRDLPPTWHLACWHDKDTPAYCREDGIYYGRWLRRLAPAEKVESVFATFGARPPAFWLVFSHMVPGDDRQMLGELVRQGYRIESAVQAKDASACLVAKVE